MRWCQKESHYSGYLKSSYDGTPTNMDFCRGLGQLTEGFDPKGYGINYNRKSYGTDSDQRALYLVGLMFQIQVLEKDEQIHELSSKLRDAELKSLSLCTEDHLSRTSTDLALERARCDELTLTLHESEGLLSQVSIADCLSYALENQRLIEEAREAKQQLVSYRAKLCVSHSIPFRFRFELIIRDRHGFAGNW
ncbi:unnamed protein product [Haemonchus placei]|uniref:Tektin n=1 Tax=Haemonchus placei TaxID=6290 RepID=A0A0N4VUZ5_HAEPC|nr:unnamed protein product [Haemonchus placei]